MKKLVLYFIFVLFSFVSCAPRVTNLTPALLEQRPSLNSYLDYEVPFDEYHTFSVMPISVLNDESKLKGGILEKQMLFLLRNYFEAKGYDFVEIDDNPDFVVTIDAFSQYEEIYVPPSTGIMPTWIPGKKVSSTGTSFGTFNLNSYSGTSGWGSYSGMSSTTTYVPGHLELNTYTKPGYSQGYYFPSISLYAFDANSKELVWSAVGVGTSHNNDIRVSGQFVLQGLVGDFPNPTEFTRNKGQIGVYIAIATNDGNNYFPTILKVIPYSPAYYAGIQLHDMIIEINGVPTVNKPLSEIDQLCNQDVGEKLRMVIWRVGREVEVAVEIAEW
jgi:hypothetical protein